MQDDFDNNDNDSEWIDQEGVKSKTQIKKEMLALQDLGESLIALSADQLQNFPISETLRQALLQTPKIKQHSAKKRHLQYIGKLMRSEDGEAIARIYHELQEAQHRAARQHHLIEKWRDALLDESARAIEEFIKDYPNCDRQQLRQLIRAAQQEKKANKPPASARKLFRFIREIIS